MLCSEEFWCKYRVVLLLFLGEMKDRYDRCYSYW
jgi:hypothetical protein